MLQNVPFLCVMKIKYYLAHKEQYLLIALLLEVIRIQGIFKAAKKLIRCPKQTFRMYVFMQQEKIVVRDTLLQMFISSAQLRYDWQHQYLSLSDHVNCPPPV